MSSQARIEAQKLVTQSIGQLIEFDFTSIGGSNKVYIANTQENETGTYEKLDEDIRSDRELIPEVSFSAIGPKAGVDGGSTEFEEDDLMLSSVRFHAGCSTSFMAEIKFRGEVEEVEFDPFSGYVLAMEE